MGDIAQIIAQGRQSYDQHQLNLQSLAEGRLSIGMDEIALEQTRNTWQRQQQLIQALQQLNGQPAYASPSGILASSVTDPGAGATQPGAPSQPGTPPKATGGWSSNTNPPLTGANRAMDGATDMVTREVSKLMTEADLAATYGFPEQSKGWLDAAGTLMERQYQLSQLHWQQQVARASMIGRVFGNVTDEASWNQAKLAYPSITGEALPPRIANAPYNPKFVQAMNNASQSQLEQAQAVRDKAAAKQYESVVDLNKARAKQAASIHDLNEAKAAAVGKAGGIDAKIPATLVRQFVDLASMKYSVVPTDPDSAKIADYGARETAEIYNTLIALNPKMDREQARREAFATADARGVFMGLQAKQADAPGSTPSQPADVPMHSDWWGLGETHPDVSKLKQGQYYKIPKPDGTSEVRRFTGLVKKDGKMQPGFEAVGRPPPGLGQMKQDVIKDKTSKGDYRVKLVPRSASEDAIRMQVVEVQQRYDETGQLPDGWAVDDNNEVVRPDEIQ